MAQFAVHRNPHAATARWIPYLLVLQDDLLSELDTVVVAPLVDAEAFGRPARILNPTFTIEGQPVVLSTAELAGVSRDSLGAEVVSLAHERNTIIAACDLLLTGI
ncbi:MULTISPECIES: CcdB family protein [unclassified Thioalkalivibrio]|uniref:CcdB family protein n=1 Tax=unclassified Thioalkalivibrio TaxID=2621013 RepID=UPI00037D2A79|nr:MULTISPECIES: CcdB family protein [unclassified Thioalkalivibrio]